MFNKENTEAIIKGIAYLNNKMGIWSFIVPIIFAITILLLLYVNYKKPSKKKTGLLLLAYAIIYVYSGYTIFLGKDFMGLKMSLMGAIGLWLIALLLILDIIFGWTLIRVPSKTHLKVLSWFFILGGIFLYPLLELMVGFKYPRMVFLGAECPTTITLIGIFIGSIPRINKVLFILISLNALIIGTSVALSGAYFDYFYALAGITGILMLIIHFKELFLSHRKSHRRA